MDKKKKKYKDMTYHEKLEFERKEREKKERKAKQAETQKEAQKRFCALCHRPISYKGDFCRGCKLKKEKLIEKIGYKVSNREIIWLKGKLNVPDIFAILDTHPEKIKMIYDVSRLEKANVRKEVLSETRSPVYKENDYIKNISEQPKCLDDFFKKHPNLEYLTIEGQKYDPYIYFRCKSCDKEFKFLWSKLRVSQQHGCQNAHKSSGESAVEDFLKNNKIKYKTQYKTLKCVNPKTKHPMPYDFELVDYKIIIEVQGDQHTEFIEYFHGTKENYEYQVWKDCYKKNFALSKGYRYIEIFYEDIKSGKYKDMLKEII